jgi:cation:H+ antiporter
LAPYVTVLALGDLRLHLLPLPNRVHAALREALGGGFVHPPHPLEHGPLWRPMAVLTASLVGIVVGATVMVGTALTVADSLHLSHALVGLLILSVVTSLPNMSTALRLARQGRGDAVVSETMNSGTINLVVGIVIPATILGVGVGASGAQKDLGWLAALTILTLLALAAPRGAGRVGGAMIVICYAAFVLSHVD